MLYKVFYTNRCIAPQFAAETYGPFIFIRPEKREDVSLLEHEKTHVRQFWRTCGIAGLLYTFSKRWKLRYEVEAYREQLKHAPGREVLFASYLATWYDLNITRDEAQRLLTT